MKKLFTILIILINFWITNGQKYHSKTLDYKNCKEFIFNKKNKDSTIYKITAPELKTLIKCKEKKFTLLYVFSPWCDPVREKMKEVVKLLKQKETDIVFLSIEHDNSKRLNYFYNYFLRIHYTYPLFLVSEEYSKGSEKKLRLFLEELNPDRDYKNVGAGSLILFDMDGNLIYCSDYTYENPVEDVKNIINR